MLTFPVLIVYKQLWSSFLWALCTSETRTDGGTSCLNEGFQTWLRYGSQTQPNKHTFTLSLLPKHLPKRERENARWKRYDDILSCKYIFSHTVCSATKEQKSKQMHWDNLIFAYSVMASVRIFMVKNFIFLVIKGKVCTFIWDTLEATVHYRVLSKHTAHGCPPRH